MNIIDALILTVGLDASEFEKGQKQASESLKKTKDEAVKQGSAIEESGRKAADAISSITRQALTLYAVLVGGKGLKEFVTDITRSDGALGRFSDRIGVGTATMSAWGLAVERNGGNAESAAASFDSLTNSLTDLQQTGQSGITEWYYRLAAAGGMAFDRSKAVKDQMLDIADALKHVTETQGAATANWYGKKIGLDQDTIDFLRHGRGAVKDQVNSASGFAVSPEAARRAQELTRQLVTLKQEATALGREIMTYVTPVIVDIIQRITAWIDKNHEWIAASINEKVKQFADFLKNIDWDAIEKGISNFVTEANKAATAVGGWKNVAEGLFALWLGAKFAGVLANIALLSRALFGANAVAGTSILAGLGFMGGALGLGAGGSLLYGEGHGNDTIHNQVADLIRRGIIKPKPIPGGASVKDAARRGHGGEDATASYHDSNSFFDAIIQAEGTGKHGNAYNTSLGYMKSPKPLTEMTMDEAMAWGEQVRRAQGLNSSAKGAFQIVNTTQRAAMKALGIKGDELFNEENQKRMASWIARKQGLGAWEGLKIHPRQMAQAAAGLNAGADRNVATAASGGWFPSFLSPAQAAPAHAAPRAQESGAPPAAPPVPTPAPAHGLTSLRAAAAAQRIANDNRTSSSTTDSRQVHIGAVNVHTAATDANGIASDMNGALERHTFASQANYGLR